MPLAKSQRTELLLNIARNLADSANHSDLTVLKGTTTPGREQVAATFVPLTRATPYTLVTPGPVTLERPSNFRRNAYTALVHVVHQKLTDQKHYATLVGTAAVEGIDTLVQAIMDALERSRPYNDGTHITGDAAGYVTQTGVVNALGRDIEEPSLDVVEGLPGLYLRTVLRLEYDLRTSNP